MPNTRGGRVGVCAGVGGVGVVYKKATRSAHSHNHSQRSIGILRTLCPQHGVVTAVNVLSVWQCGRMGSGGCVRSDT